MLYHLLLEEAKDPVKFSGNHGFLLLRMLDKAKKATPAEWMSAGSLEGASGDTAELGNAGWMRSIAMQADFHVTRWTRPLNGGELELSPPSGEDSVVQASLSRAIATHRNMYPDIADSDDFWELGVLESGIAMYAGLHPRVNAVAARGPGPVPLMYLNGGGGGKVPALPLTTLSAALRRLRNYLFDGNGPVDIFCESVLRIMWAIVQKLRA